MIYSFVKSKVLFTLAMLTIIVVSFQNCSPVAFVPVAQDLSSKSQDCSTDPSLCPTGPQCTFNGQNYFEGQTVTAYLYSTVPAGKECTSEVRTCVGGSFTGSYAYAACGVDAPGSCLFNGKTVAHGQSVDAFQNSSVAFGGACAKESRTCSNGVFSGTYNFATCSVGAAASCLFNGQTVAHGASVKSFQSSSVSYGQTCVSEDRTCNNGVLSGSYNFASCAVGSASSCLFNGQSVAHGGTVVGYAASTVAYGQTCASQTRACNNGVLSGTYSFASCAPGAAASCTFNGASIAHGQSAVAYATSTVGFGATCAAQTRTCNNGVMSGSYQYSSCTTNAAASCSFNGQTIGHGSSVYAYASNSASYGSSCSSQVRTCNNGSLSGSYSYSSCSVSQCPSGQVYNSGLNRCVSSLYGQYCTFYGAPVAVDQPNSFQHCQLDGRGVWTGQNYCEYNSRGCGLGYCQCYTDGSYDENGVCRMASQRQNAYVNAGYIRYFGYIHLDPSYGWSPRPTTNMCR